MSALIVLKFPFLDREILLKAITEAGLRIKNQTFNEITVSIPNMLGYEFTYTRTDIGYSCQIPEYVKQHTETVRREYETLYNDKKRKLEEERQRKMEENFKALEVLKQKEIEALNNLQALQSSLLAVPVNQQKEIDKKNAELKEKELKKIQAEQEQQKLKQKKIDEEIAAKEAEKKAFIEARVEKIKEIAKKNKYNNIKVDVVKGKIQITLLQRVY